MRAPPMKPFTAGRVYVNHIGDDPSWAGPRHTTRQPFCPRAAGPKYGGAMRFAVLGPLLVDGARRAARGSARCCPGCSSHPRAVPADELIEAAWPPDRPDGVTRSLHVRIAKLRALLDRPSPGRRGLVRDAGGLPAHRGPRQRRRAAVRQVAEEARAGRRRSALAVCDEALALWRGEPFADLDARRRRRDRRGAPAASDPRPACRRTRATALTGARAAPRTPPLELEALVAEDPLREELVA